jgi:hypothetical protein
MVVLVDGNFSEDPQHLTRPYSEMAWRETDIHTLITKITEYLHDSCSDEYTTTVVEWLNLDSPHAPLQMESDFWFYAEIDL